MKIPISPHPNTNTFLFIFLILVILVDVKWYLIVILIYISLMANNAKHCFMCLLAIYISSWKKCLFKSFTHFLIGLFVYNYQVWMDTNLISIANKIFALIQFCSYFLSPFAAVIIYILTDILYLCCCCHTNCVSPYCTEVGDRQAEQLQLASQAEPL